MLFYQVVHEEEKNIEGRMLGICRITASCYFANLVVYILMVSSVQWTNSDEFESLLELPRYRKRPDDRIESMTHVSVKDFGAKGDGYAFDTEVTRVIFLDFPSLNCRSLLVFLSVLIRRGSGVYPSLENRLLILPVGS